MNFNPNYITDDGIFDVEIDMDSLVYKAGSSNIFNWSEDITDNIIQVYNNNTEKISKKSLYLSNGKLYFRGNKGRGKGTRRYYIDTLKLK